MYGVVSSAPPTIFVDAAGKPSGFFVEFYSRVMDDLGIPYEYSVGSFAELYPKLIEGKIDFFTTLQRTPGREALFYFPERGSIVGWGQLFVAPHTEVESILDLQNQKIGVVSDDQNGNNFRTYIASLSIPCQIVEFSDFDELVRAVLAGRVYGGVQSSWFVTQEYRAKPTTIVFGPFQSYPVLSRRSGFTDEFRAIAIHAESLMNDPRSYYYDLQRKWLGRERIETVVLPSWIIAGLAALFLCSVVAVCVIRALTRKLRAVNRQLERTVAERTSLLVRSEQTASLGKLAAGVAHELNTPLHALLASVEVARSTLGAELDRIFPSGGAAEQNPLHSVGWTGLTAVGSDTISARKRVRERLAALGFGGDPSLESLLLELGLLDPDAETLNRLRELPAETRSDLLQRLRITGSLDIAHRTATRMGAIVSALMAYGRQQIPSKLSDIDLEAQVDSVLALFQPRFGAGIQVLRNYVGLPPFRGYPDQTQQIWLNLITNAVEAMEGAGTLAVSTLVDGKFLKVEVANSGPKIPLDRFQRIFDPFFSTKEGRPGLGLSVAREFARAHRGELEARLVPAGACFLVTFPRGGGDDV